MNDNVNEEPFSCLCFFVHGVDVVRVAFKETIYFVSEIRHDLGRFDDILSTQDLIQASDETYHADAHIVIITCSSLV